jgi:hypothetical protein
MEINIEILKRLVIAHDIAEHYDYVPSFELAGSIHHNLGLCSIEDAESICNEFNGNSPDDILFLLKSVIKKI